MSEISRFRFGTLWAAGALGIVMAAGPMAAGMAQAQDMKTVRVGKSVATAFTFVPADVGVQEGIWEKLGLKVEVVAFNGDAQMQQALTAGSIEFGLGSGPGMGYAVKGVPAMGVAAFADAPKNMELVVTNMDYNDIDDMKGKKIGVTTAGSLTYWIVKEVNRQKGWEGADAMQPLAMGSTRTRLAAMKTGEIDASVGTTMQAAELEANGEGKGLISFGDIVTDFHTHVIFAHDNLIENDKETVKKFLQGWFQTVKLMKENRKLAVEVGARVMNVDEAVIDKIYDGDMSMMSDDGAFDPAAVELISESLVELGILPTKPKPEELFTDEFVPVVLTN